MDEAVKLKFDAIWKARDNELNAVRERTLLAWGFLMFCYGGYGYLAHEVLFQSGLSEARFDACNITMLFIALVCARLSVYWIQLAKGAKAWAENFDFIAEGFQHKFFRSQDSYLSCSFRTDDQRKQADASVGKVFIRKNCGDCRGDPTYACVFSVNSPESGYYTDVDENILTSKSGAFSPAATIISIARLSLIIAICLVVGNIVTLVFGKEWLEDIKIFLIIGLVFVFFGFPIFCMLVRSQGKRDKGKKESHKWWTPIRKWWTTIHNAVGYLSNVSMSLRDIKEIRKIYASKNGGAK